MWQLTWMLSLLPDWLWTLVLIAGVLAILAAWVLKFIPFVSTYKLPLQVGGVLFLLIGVYFQGVIANEAKYKAEHDRLQAEIEVAKNAFAETNEKLAATLKERDDALAKRPNTIIRNVDRWLKSDPTTIIKDMTPDERARYESQSKEEREKFEKRIKELQDSVKNCPVPQIIVEGINEAAKPPAKGDKK